MRRKISWQQFVDGLASGLYSKPDGEYSRLRIIARQARGLVQHVSSNGAPVWSAWHRRQAALRQRLIVAAEIAERAFDQYATAHNMPNVKPWSPRQWSTVKRQQRQADLAYRPTKRRAA
jgi:hypothetical protein